MLWKCLNVYMYVCVSLDAQPPFQCVRDAACTSALDDVRASPSSPDALIHPLLILSSTLISLSLSLLSFSSLGDSELYSLGCLSVSWQADRWALEGLLRDFCGSVWDYRGGYLEWTLRNLQSGASRVWMTAAEPIQISKERVWMWNLLPRVVNIETKNCKDVVLKVKCIILHH